MTLGALLHEQGQRDLVSKVACLREHRSVFGSAIVTSKFFIVRVVTAYLHHSSQAIPRYLEAIAIDPTMASAHNNLGRARAERQEWYACNILRTNA